MATVNYSVPEAVKKAFDKAFKGKNKSAVIAEMMRRAVEEQERQKRTAEAIARLREIGASGPRVTTEEILADIRAGRERLK